MKVDKILEYQNLDTEMFKIERQLKENQNKRMASEAHERMKNAQSHSIDLEKKAGALLTEIDKVKKQLKIQEDKMEEFLQKDVANMGKEEVEHLSILKNKLAQNLQILEKNLTTLAESMNATLSDFNKTIKTFNSSKEEFAKCKNAYDEDVKAVEGQKAEIEKKLAEIAKSCDSNLMESYLKRRKENVFPVIVPLKGNSCGGCHVELPFVSVAKLNDEGVLVCEHCRRIIYKN